jgi:hypothetical protein
VLRSAIVIAAIGTLVALGVTLAPMVDQYWAAYQHTEAATLAKLKTPRSAKVNDELSLYDLNGYVATHTRDEIVAAAASLGSGSLPLPDGTKATVGPEFRANDLDNPASSVQLAVASLVLPDVYLATARFTGDQQYFDRAADYLHEWWRYEQDTWLPTGLQWNDHSIAARIYVLTRYWLAAQERGGKFAAAAEWVPDALQVSAARLLKPGAFTLRTNHGLMQSLALLHIATCFPELPLAAHYRDVGVARVALQASWYLSPEGVVLEHSAGYHAGGVTLLGMALNYIRQLGVPAPAGLEERVHRAKEFSAALMRPDETLPPIGDTTAKAPWTLESDSAKTKPNRGDFFLPLSGYAIWWSGLEHWSDNGPLSQLTATWSHFATEAHRHMDEMSMTLWANGRDWIVASGYWPYDSPLRTSAESWEGANGPHAIGETRPLPQSTRALSHAFESGGAAMELLRDGARGARFRRQIIQAGSGLWIVLDSRDGTSSLTTETVWTMASDLLATRSSNSNVFFLAAPNGAKGQLSIATSDTAAQVELLRARPDSAIGWTALDGIVRPAWSVVLNAPPNTASATVIDINRGTAEHTDTQLHWRSSDDWDVVYEVGSTRVVTERSAAKVNIRRSQLSGPKASEPRVSEPIDVELTLVDVDPAVAESRIEVDRNYLQAKKNEPPFNEGYSPFRIRLAKFIFGAAIVQFIGLWALGYLHRRRSIPAPALIAVPILLALGWGAVSAWIGWIYFP